MKDLQRIHLIDSTLRDGSHAMSHQYTVEQMVKIAVGLDRAGIEYIEVSHGDGLAGSSLNYGRSLTAEPETLKAVSNVLQRASLTVLLIPGIGTQEDLKMAVASGARAVRVATHVTEANVAEQHIGMAKNMGLRTFGFLMMSHMVEPSKIAEQARLFERYGADGVYIADSAGAMLMDDVKAKIGAVVEAVRIPVGFHAHNNLTLATANSLAAIEAGATYIDGTCRGIGAGAGNTQIEALTGVLDKKGYQTGVKLYKIMDVAEQVVEPIMHRPQIVSNDAFMLGYAGVYSSFLLHIQRAAQKFSLDPRDILVEIGRRKMVGGQEDMIIDVAYHLAHEGSPQPLGI